MGAPMNSPTNYTTKCRWQNRVRWTVAHHLNHLPWTCWANLVSWAMHSRPLLSRDGDDMRQDWMCARDAADCGHCYCGKITAAEEQRRAMSVMNDYPRLWGYLSGLAIGVPLGFLLAERFS
jgi:hypothetical protein